LCFFNSWAFFLQIFPCFNIVSCQFFIQCIELPNPSLTQWNTMSGCMISFTLERRIPRTFVAITHNNDVVWSMSWTPLSLILLMIFCIMSPIWASIFSMEVDELEGWLWHFYFSTLGEVSSNFISSHISTTHGFSEWSSSAFSSLESMS